MNHVAVDLGSKQSHFCERAPDGALLREARLKNVALRDFFSHLEPSSIVLEACSEAFTVAGWAKEFGHKVTVVPSTLAPALGVGARGVKTDKRDAENLSLASCRMAALPSVHVPSASATALRQRLSARHLLVQMRTMVTNHVKGYLRQQVTQLKPGASKSLAKRVREHFLATGQGVPGYLEHLLLTHEALCEQLQKAQAELRELVKNDEVCRRLMTAPGVGPVTAAAFRSAVDEIERFPSAHQVESYLGLTGREDSSGERQRRGSISKAGPSLVRAAMVQAAWAAWRTAPKDPAVKWAQQLARRRSMLIAIVGLARKLVGILFALWRDNSEYSSHYK